MQPACQRIMHLPPSRGTGFKLFCRYRCPRESRSTAPSIALAGKSESPRVLTEPEIKDYIYAPTKTMGNTYMVSDLMAQTVTTLSTSFKYPTHTRVDGVETKSAGHDWGRRSLMLPWITSVQSDLLSYLSWSTLHSKGT